MQSLRNLAVALAKDSIFGEDELKMCSLSGRKNSKTKPLKPAKLGYIKQLEFSRIAYAMQEKEFDLLWEKKCLQSIGSKCQALRKKN